MYLKIFRQTIRLRYKHLYINLNQNVLSDYVCCMENNHVKTFILVDVSSCISGYIGLLFQIYNMYCHDHYEVNTMVNMIYVLYYCCNQ